MCRNIFAHLDSIPIFTNITKATRLQGQRLQGQRLQGQRLQGRKGWSPKKLKSIFIAFYSSMSQFIFIHQKSKYPQYHQSYGNCQLCTSKKGNTQRYWSLRGHLYVWVPWCILNTLSSHITITYQTSLPVLVWYKSTSLVKKMVSLGRP